MARTLLLAAAMAGALAVLGPYLDGVHIDDHPPRSSRPATSRTPSARPRLGAASSTQPSWCAVCSSLARGRQRGSSASRSAPPHDARGGSAMSDEAIQLVVHIALTLALLAGIATALLLWVDDLRDTRARERAKTRGPGRANTKVSRRPRVPDPPSPNP